MHIISIIGFFFLKKDCAPRAIFFLSVFSFLTLEVTETLPLTYFPIVHLLSDIWIPVGDLCFSLWIIQFPSLNLLMLVCRIPYYTDSLIDKLTCVSLPDTSTKQIFLHHLNGWCQQYRRQVYGMQNGSNFRKIDVTATVPRLHFFKCYMFSHMKSAWFLTYVMHLLYILKY